MGGGCGGLLISAYSSFPSATIPFFLFLITTRTTMMMMTITTITNSTTKIPAAAPPMIATVVFGIVEIMEGVVTTGLVVVVLVALVAVPEGNRHMNS